MRTTETCLAVPHGVAGPSVSWPARRYTRLRRHPVAGSAMIAFASAITKPDVYRVAPSRASSAPPSPTRRSTPAGAAGSISESYNRAARDRAAARDDLEALVLVHQDTEIVDADLCAKVREALADPDVGVVGCVGAIGVRSIAWWEGSVTLASFANRYEEHGGGDLPALLVGLGRRAALRAAGRGGDARRLPARAVALGGAQRPLRRGAERASTATTSTSASRCARPAARW